MKIRVCGSLAVLCAPARPEEAADLGTVLVEYADARQRRIETENAMFERLAEAAIDLSMFEVPSD